MSPLNPERPRDPGPALTGPRPGEDAAEFSRRRFLQVMGASFALASAAGCRWESEEILPFQRRPEGRVPGTTRRFATALEENGVAASLLVTSYDGRPIKIEGNPLHPRQGGAASARTQAAILDLYDPDHSGGLVQVHEGVAWPRTWMEFDPWFAGEMERRRAAAGQGLAVLAEPSSSLALAAARARLLEAMPRARWVTWDPTARTQEIDGARLAFGRALRSVPRIENARTVVCLDADLLGEHPDAIANARAFAARRDPRAEDYLRLWCAESTPTLTGAAADERLALRAEQVHPFLLALEARVRAALGAADGRPLTGGFLDAPSVARWLDRLAAEIAERRDATLVTVGPRQPAHVHALVHRLHGLLGGEGRTHELVEESAWEGQGDTLQELARALQAGEIECLVILGGNPVYDAPADLELRRALREVPLSLHLSHQRDETSRACTWHLPRAHALESWGDAASWDGTRCTTQPLIEPIFPRRTPLELVAAMAGMPGTAQEIVRAAVAPGASDAEWRQVLHDGFVAGSARAVAAPAVASFDVPAPSARQLALQLSNGELELVLAPDPKVLDGRSANNAWLQELPDPITKTTWGNAARFAPATAEALGVADATLVRLSVGGRALEVAAVVVPGQAEGSVTLHLGYGRTAAGRVGGLPEEGIGTVGFDANRLRTSGTPAVMAGLSVAPTGRAWALARTTDPSVDDAIGEHGVEQRLGELLREFDLEHWRAHPHAEEHAPHHPPLESLWEHDAQDGRRWGMAIDLNACIGCNACTLACQAENNVPVVGREQVMRGREMHWIRVDRYFVGPPDAQRARFQPITCQHCESAPCEQVCPVAATVHSAEGLNDMVYNRCVGTRYCANNCPFKVRRFNFFNYHKDVEAAGAEVQRMRHNPEVTLRHRGVMEKCTFCVQRIQAAKIQARNAGRPIADGELTTACAQTCPTQAIVFGDLADPSSRVARIHQDSRAYTMLAELNIRPRTAYLARIANPHPGGATHGG